MFRVVEAEEDTMQLGAGELPLERLRDLLVVGLEAKHAAFELVAGAEVIGGEGHVP